MIKCDHTFTLNKETRIKICDKCNLTQSEIDILDMLSVLKKIAGNNFKHPGREGCKDGNLCEVCIKSLARETITRVERR